MITNLEDVDRALRDKLKGLTVDNVEVPVVVIDPEPEFVAEHYPCIVLYRNGAYPDDERYSNDPIKFNYTFDVNGNPVSYWVKPNPVPYNAYYCVRLYYDEQKDGAYLNTHLLKQFRKGAYLSINGELFDVEMVSYRNPNSTYREFGVIKENKAREFIDQYLYKIQINLDCGDEAVLVQVAQTSPTVTQSLK